MGALVLLDMSAAFDTVDHALLIDKLQTSFGISETALKWFMSYLTNRSFAVRVGKKKAKTIKLMFGVPQGSLLGPILFILYTKEIAVIAECYGLSVMLYADDTQIYLGFEPINKRINMEKSFSSCLIEIEKWMATHYLKLNVDKTNILFIGSRRNTLIHSDLNINHNNILIEKPDKNFVKTLGVRIDKNLTMEYHVNNIIQIGYFHLRRFYRIRYCFDVETKILIVSSYVLSKMDFCNSILALITEKLINKLQKLINSSIRFIYLYITSTAEPQLQTMQRKLIFYQQNIEFNTSYVL